MTTCNRSLLLPIAILLLTLGGWMLFAAGYRINTTPSLPTGVYRFEDAPVEHGSLAAYCLDGPFAALAGERGYLAPGSCPSGLRPLLKITAALPGDRLRQGSDGIRVNGSLWPFSRAAITDSKGKTLSPAQLPTVVPAGMAILLSQHPGGFDSRYFGPVPLVGLRRVMPVFTL